MKPLDGIKILDLTQFLAGSYCTMIFSGLGAEVIKIEPPVKGDPARHMPPYVGEKGVSISRETRDDISLAVLKRCRNKKGISLNLKSPKGKEIFLRLVEKADVVVENFRPGIMNKLGLSYSVLSEANPKIVYCSLTGFGAEGAYANLPAFDIVIQAIGGAMSVNGHPDGPPTRSGIATSDLAGGLFSCIGIMAALEYCHKTGKGQQVDVSMLDSVLSFMMDEAPDFWISQGYPPRSGSRLTRLTPFNVYKAKDGYYVIAHGSNDHWLGILNVMGREDLYDDERYKDQPGRIARADEVDAIINAWSEQKYKKDILSALEIKGIPCSQVREVPEVLSDKNLLDLGTVVPIIHPNFGEVPSVKAAGMPIRFSASKTGFDQPAPTLGQHNSEVYEDWLNLSQKELEDLKAEGTV
ncbi:MAG: CoA transferase [Deltaproteobacteria bacterium]|nr:CoA transferase [Deltaproteobacteria bacterium]MCX5828163.1 CoA transferase [Deltaproteobacteria bacterium]